MSGEVSNQPVAHNPDEQPHWLMDRLLQNNRVFVFAIGVLAATDVFFGVDLFETGKIEDLFPIWINSVGAVGLYLGRQRSIEKFGKL